MKQSSQSQYLLLGAVVITALGQTIVYAILPSLGRATGLADVHVGAIISASALFFALASPVWGRFSEHIGRKPVVIIGLTGYGLGTLLFASAFWFGLRGYALGSSLLLLLILSRTIQSVVMAATPPAVAAYMADTSTAETRTKAMAKIGAAHNIGTVLGPAAGGAIAAISLLAPLYISAVLILLMVITVAKLMPESPYILSRTPPTESFSVAQTLAETLKAYFDPRLIKILSVGIGIFFAFAVVQQTLGFLIQDRLALPPMKAAGKVGIAMMFAALTSISAQLIIVQKLTWPPERLLKTAVPLMMLGVAFLIVANENYQIVLAMCLAGLGVGLGMPGITSAASLMVGANEQGAVAGLMSAAPALGYTLGPVVGTGLYQLNTTYPYLLVLLIFLPVTWTVWRLSTPSS